MVTYFDKIMYLYPDIQGFSYWHTQYDGSPWKNPYDGIVWENKIIEKPSQELLDSLNDDMVKKELERRQEQKRKQARNESASNDLSIKAAYSMYLVSHPESTFEEYLDYLEALGN